MFSGCTSGRPSVMLSRWSLINEVNLRRARLVLGWVTVSGCIFLVRDIYLYTQVNSAWPSLRKAQ